MTDSFGELQDGDLAARLRRPEGGRRPRRPPAGAATAWRSSRAPTAPGPWPIKTAWDTTADAAEFETAATTALAKAQGIAQVLPGEGGKIRWVLVASDAATMSSVAGVLGLAG